MKNTERTNYQVIYEARAYGKRIRLLVEAQSEDDARQQAIRKGVSHIVDVRPASDVWGGPDFDSTIN